MVRIVLGLIASVCFVVWGNRETVQSFVGWNLHNLPFVVALYLYPILKKGYRILRFYLFA
jgi:F0F1-type ATP synthase assembly protein I